MTTAIHSFVLLLALADMRIGYPCIHRTLPNGSAKSFRLKSFTPQRFRETVAYNLESLFDILQWNYRHNFLYFRISSQLIPFASHPICTIDWQNEFAELFKRIGDFISKNQMRVSFHPDQFTLLNSPSESIFENSLRELRYHAAVLEAMNLPQEHKIQIHVGGIYNDKQTSIQRFIDRFALLPDEIKTRLAIENDDRLYSLADCLSIHRQTGVPIVFDTFHHSLLNHGESISHALSLAHSTWGALNGPLMVDYSSQEHDKRSGSHATSLNLEDFESVLPHLQALSADVMLEIKDKEKSGLKILRYLQDWV